MGPSRRCTGVSIGLRARVGVYELEEKTVPREVAINEAVVLAKRYATDDAARLVNGVLARVAREQEAA